MNSLAYSKQVPQRWVEKIFRIRERKSSVRVELVAGLTTFLTMSSYVLFVNPSTLAQAGIPIEAATASAILATIFGSLLYGLLANLPIAIAPGVGLNVLFTYTVVLHMGLPWQTALGAVFISGVVFTILTVTGVRKKIIMVVPFVLRNSATVGIGLFIAFIGFKNAGIIIKNDSTFVSLGNILSPGPILAMIGLIIATILIAMKIRGALLISICFTTILSMILGVTHIPDSISDLAYFSFPDLSAFMALDIKAAIEYGIFSVIFTFTVVELFDNSITMLCLTQKANLIQPNGEIENMEKAFVADSLSTMASAVFGSTAMNAYSDNAVGIAEGGKTGLTALVVAFLFILSIPFLPMVKLIPAVATAPALILIGVYLIEEIRFISFSDFTDTIPAFLTMILIPLTFSITDGLAFGFISYSLLKVLTGRWKEVHWLVHVISFIFVIHFINYNFPIF